MADLGVESDLRTCAKRTAATHFSTNPVHCLRSKFILEHKPPQAIYAVGKEHFMVANPQIGSHYQSKAAKKLAVVAKLDQEELFADTLELPPDLCGPSALKGKLPSEPCFVIMAAKGDQLLFITWLPEGAAVRQKMKTSTFKASVLDQVKALSDKDLVMAEVSEDDDLEDSLADSQKVPEAAAPVAPEAAPVPKGSKPPAGAVALPGLSPTKPNRPAQGYSESPAAPSSAEEKSTAKETPLFEEKETAGKMAFAGTSPEAAPAEITETLSLAELQDASVWKGRNVIATERERYLPEDVFQSLFGKGKEEFAKLPKWKRDNEKKKHGLF
eukprot:s3167_g1.t1